MKNTLLYFVFPIIILFFCLAVGDVIHIRSMNPTLDVTDSFQRAFGLQGAGVAMLVPKDETPNQSTTKKQYVVMAFDGSRSLDMWQLTRDFAKEMTAQGKPLHFTYFINAVYLLDPQDKYLFQAPHMPKGVSNIGFGYSESDVLKRIDQINGAVAEGHDIGSHNTGHYEGSKWTYDEWKTQLGMFTQFVFHPELLNPKYKLNVTLADMVGFRAPDLGVNKNTYTALAEDGFKYDASLVSEPNIWPKKLAGGMWEFPLPTPKFLPDNKLMIAMDYNLYVHQTGARDILKKGTPEWNSAYDATYQSFMNYFNKSYTENRAPVYMANHFSLWNDGLYWEVMKRFATDVCGKPDVVCGSYKDLMNYMNTITPANS